MPRNFLKPYISEIPNRIIYCVVTSFCSPRAYIVSQIRVLYFNSLNRIFVLPKFWFVARFLFVRSKHSRSQAAAGWLILQQHSLQVLAASQTAYCAFLFFSCTRFVLVNPFHTFRLVISFDTAMEEIYSMVCYCGGFLILSLHLEPHRMALVQVSHSHSFLLYNLRLHCNNNVF